MAKLQYSFYPGCSSQKGASSSNYLVSVQTMCEELDIQLNEIPNWNCCAASIGYAGGGELPRLTLSARNIALSEQHNPGQEIVACLSQLGPPAGSPPGRRRNACTRTSRCWPSAARRWPRPGSSSRARYPSSTWPRS